MKAVGLTRYLPIDDPQALIDVEIATPVPKGRDLLVRIEAVSVNPVDTKVRAPKDQIEASPRILGYDASGVVEAVGDAVTLFQPGDHVYYAGDITRPGTNSELHLVDERIVGRKPTSIGFAEAAALPLTAITAWEMLFDRLEVTRPVAGAANALVIIGGAGGVGSIAIQLARALADLTVIATASRPETRQWAQELGAHHVIDHRQPVAAQVAALGIGAPAFVFSTTNSDDHLGEIVELLAPQGRFGLIDDPKALDANPLKRKSISLHWELMFTRSMFATADIERQHDLLNKVAELVDAGTVRTTLADHFGTINAANLRRAHALIESGKAKGKIVLEGF